MPYWCPNHPEIQLPRADASCPDCAADRAVPKLRRRQWRVTTDPSEIAATYGDDGPEAA